ncbi:MAG: twin-arginine translocase TatA/TatE family subunit [Nitrospirota bacterium]
MFGLGVPELIVIFIVALLVFGPKKLPELGRSLGRALGEFRRTTDGIKESIEAEIKDIPESTDDLWKTPSESVSTGEKQGELTENTEKGHLKATTEKEKEITAEEETKGHGKEKEEVIKTHVG